MVQGNMMIPYLGMTPSVQGGMAYTNKQTRPKVREENSHKRDVQGACHPPWLHLCTSSLLVRTAYLHDHLGKERDTSFVQNCSYKTLPETLMFDIARGCQASRGETPGRCGLDSRSW